MFATPDPASAFFDAHERGRCVSLRTSGTAGTPHSVVRTTESWVCSFAHVTALLEMDADSRIWVPGPLTATMNLFAAVHARHLGARLVTEPGSATHAHLTASMLSRLLDDRRVLSRQHVVVAGDRLPRPLSEQARTAGLTVSHYYGAAELSFVAWGSHEDNLRPFPEVEVSVRDGELWVRSPYLCQDYDGERELQRDPDGFVTVGDRGALVGEYLSVSGRGTAAVTTGGATVHVADVEAELRRVVAGEVVVIGIPHDELGHVVAALLTDAGSFARARAHSRAALSPEQRPRIWFEIGRLPLSDAGKLDRRALADLVVARGEGVRRLS